MNLIFLGPQTSGKGTQAGMLAKKLGIPVLTTGNILRTKKAAGDDEGKLIASFIDKGNLLPDELIDIIVRKELEAEKYKKGVILDGYPRNSHQAEELEKFLNIDKVIFLDVPDGLVVKRMSSRRICEKCGENFNLISRPSAKDGVCDVCGGKLMQRHDDTEVAIAVRLNIYHELTEPLIKYYEERGKLIKIDGTKSIEDVWSEVSGII
ncbi:MAG: nucleoside monophosphate kinase [bacterium]